MSTRDIQAHFEDAYGVEESATFISQVTNAVLDEVKAWQSRPLDPVYPVVYLDALVGRKGELLRIKLSDCTEDGIEFRNNKNPDDLYLIEWTPQLKSIIHEIRSLPPRRIGSAYLFINRHGKPYINEATSETSGFDSMWQRRMK